METLTGDATAADLEHPWDSTPDADAGFDTEIPENMEIGPDNKLRYTQEFQDAQQALDDAQQDAVDAAATKQTVPDEHPGATAAHDEPMPPEEHHARVHYAADPTAPSHIPMGLIATQTSK